jgi:hypothetical protein
LDELLADLKVLGKKEVSLILKWRARIIQKKRRNVQQEDRAQKKLKKEETKNSIKELEPLEEVIDREKYQQSL